jgi:DNA-binding response OmpR family regulator
MPDVKRVIFFSNQADAARSISEVLRAGGFEVNLVEEIAVLKREVRAANERVVLLDFSSSGVDGLEILREIKCFDGSIQVVVVNAEPRVYVGVEIFRSGAEICFFAPQPDPAELLAATEAALAKVARWWRVLHDVAVQRPEAEPAGTNRERGATGVPALDEEVELVVRAVRLRGRVAATNSGGADIVIQDGAPPALLDKVFIRYRGTVLRALVRQLANEPARGWRIGLEWNISADRLPELAGARADLAMFVTLEGWRVVARSLTAVDKDVVSARLATGRVHAVPVQSIRSMTRGEREAELQAAPDLSGLAALYQLDPQTDRKTTVQAIMTIEFAVAERGPSA